MRNFPLRFNQMRHVKNPRDVEWLKNFSRWRKTGTEGFFSLTDCTSDAMSPNGTRHRNREKPNLSSLPPTIKHALHRVSSFFFMPLLLYRGESCDGDTSYRRRPVWDFYNVAWVYVPPVPKCADPRRRRYVFSSSGTTVIIIPLRFFRYSVLYVMERVGLGIRVLRCVRNCYETRSLYRRIASRTAI